MFSHRRLLVELEEFKMSVQAHRAGPSFGQADSGGYELAKHMAAQVSSLLIK
jgi:hypothetical protein